MALLRRADAAFLKLSERRSPAAGVVPAGGGTAQHRRSTRYESLRPDAAPADEPPRAEAGRAAPRAQEGPEAPPDAHPAADSAAPAMARSSAGPARATDHPSPHAHRFADGTSHWSEEIDRLLEDRSDAEQREPIANPFPNIFPGARFQRVSRPGAAMHLEGDWQRGGERLRITAVPGAYSPHPPAHLRDFTRYIRARSGGYWIRLTAY